MKNSILLTSITCALGLAATARAEPGGSAHYMPGQAASFIDAFPGKPGGFVALDYFTYYDASPHGWRHIHVLSAGTARVSRPLPDLEVAFRIAEEGFTFGPAWPPCEPCCAYGCFTFK